MNTLFLVENNKKIWFSNATNIIYRENIYKIKEKSENDFNDKIKRKVTESQNNFINNLSNQLNSIDDIKSSKLFQFMKSSFSRLKNAMKIPIVNDHFKKVPEKLHTFLVHHNLKKIPAVKYKKISHLKEYRKKHCSLSVYTKTRDNNINMSANLNNYNFLSLSSQFRTSANSPAYSTLKANGFLKKAIYNKSKISSIGNDYNDTFLKMKCEKPQSRDFDRMKIYSSSDKRKNYDNSRRQRYIETHRLKGIDNRVYFLVQGKRKYSSSVI